MGHRVNRLSAVDWNTRMATVTEIAREGDGSSECDDALESLGSKRDMDRTTTRDDFVSHVECPLQSPFPESPLVATQSLYGRTELDCRRVGILGVRIAFQPEKKDAFANRS